jgi:predicted  nucleic acid-binding Zn-ribbon protein
MSSLATKLQQLQKNVTIIEERERVAKAQLAEATAKLKELDVTPEQAQEVIDKLEKSVARKEQKLETMIDTLNEELKKFI